MKKVYLSLVTVVALSTSNLFASNSLSEALIDNSKISGTVKTVFTHANNTNIAAQVQNDDKTGAIGGYLGYETGDFYGFKIGVKGQISWDLHLHNKDGGTEDDARNTVTAKEIQSLYIDYAYKNSSIRIGRQDIVTPLIMNTYLYVLADSFDAAVVNMNELQDTTMKFMYIRKWNKRWAGDSNGSVFQEDFTYDNGLYSLYVKNNSYKPLSLELQYMKAEQDNLNSGDLWITIFDSYEQYLMKADYKLPISFPLSLGFLYEGASFDEPNKDNANVYGIELKTNLSGVNLSAAYTSTDDKSDYPGALGHVPDFATYTNGFNIYSHYAGIDAFSLQAMYKFYDKINTRVKFINIDQSEEGQKNSKYDIGKTKELNLDLMYDMSSILKGLNMRAIIAYNFDNKDFEPLNNGSRNSNQLYGFYSLGYSF